MKCVVSSGSLKYAVGDESKVFNVGDELTVTDDDYQILRHMLKPVEAVAAEKQAAKIIEKAQKAGLKNPFKKAPAK